MNIDFEITATVAGDGAVISENSGVHFILE
jgi:hypothetical protein